MENKKHCFTNIEKNIFLNILKKHRSVIENKQTDGTTTRAKNDAWDKITREFNASPYIMTQASHKQLRRLWMNLKQRQRDALTKERQHRLRTGGGPSTSDADIDPDVSQITSGLLVEVDHVFDSDVTFETADGLNVVSSINNPITTGPNFYAATPSTSPNRPLMAIPTPQSPLVSVAPTTPHLPATSAVPPPPPPPAAVPFQRHKNSILEKEYRDRQRRANELHELEVQLLKEKIREAKARADLAEILRLRQQDAPGECT